MNINEFKQVTLIGNDSRMAMHIHAIMFDKSLEVYFPDVCLEKNDKIRPLANKF